MTIYLDRITTPPLLEVLLAGVTGSDVKFSDKIAVLLNY